MPRKSRDLKRIRAEVLSIRTDPKLLLATRLAASQERRTVSSFVEWAVDRAVRGVNVTVDEDDQPVNALTVVEQIWDDDEVKRFINLAVSYDDLLTNEERALWDLIWFNTAFSRPRPNKGHYFLFDPVVYVKLDAVREHWATLKAVAAERAPRSALPKSEAINESKHSLRKGRDHG